MRGAQRDEGGLVLGQQKHFIAFGDARRATDHHPMLCAVVVHLQRQNAARLDHDAFHLKPLTGIHPVIRAPGPEHLAVDAALGAVLRFQPVDNLLYILRLVLVRHQNRVSGLHHHQITHPHAGHQAAFRNRQGVAAVL